MSSTSPEPACARYRDAFRVSACSVRRGPAQIDRQRLEIARELVADIERYDELLTASKRRIITAVAASGTSLTDMYGVGPIVAAIVIGHTGDIGRFATRDTSPATTRPHRSKRPQATRPGTVSTREGTGS